MRGAAVRSVAVFILVTAACATAAALLRHDIIATRWGYFDHDRWTGQVIACELVLVPAQYFQAVREAMAPRSPASPPPSDRKPTAEEILGPVPLTRAEAVKSLGDYIRCAERP